MKQTFTKLLLLGFVLGAFACAKKSDGEFEPGTKMALSQNTMTFNTPVDSSIKITLESDAEWVALKESTDGTDWFTVSPENGVKSTEQVSVVVSVKTNATPVQRNAKVTFSHRSGSVSTVLEIKQAPKLSKLGQDSMILVDLYEQTEGWAWNGVWDLDTPVATWFGVTLGAADGELRVVSLKLEGRKLNGPLPESLQNLTELHTLMSYQNSHGGTLPLWVTKMKKLRYLYLTQCGYGGSIPESYYDMVELRQMDLSGNGVKGPISEKIGQMINLEEIDLEGCPIGGTVPVTVKNMLNLQAIGLAGSSMTGPLTPEIGLCPKLEVIYMSDNPDITGSIPEMWGQCKTLTSIMMEYCDNLTGSLPASLANCPEWWEIRVQGASITGNLPKEWENAPELEYLILYSNKLAGEIPWSKKPASLLCLGIMNRESSGPNENKFTGQLPEWLGQVQMVYANNNDFTGPLPASLGNASTITQVLQLANNPRLSGDIPVGVWSCPSYTDILLTDNTGLTGKFPANEDVNVQSLVSLRLSNCNMSGPLPPALFTSLQVAELDGNNFEGDIPVTIATNEGLIKLSLSQNKFTSVFPEVITKHQGWVSWKPGERICPQKVGYGFAAQSCEKFVPTEQ